MSSGGVGTAEPVSDDPKAPSSSTNDVKEGAEAPAAGEEAPGKDQKADEGAESPPPQSQPMFNQQVAYHQHLTPGAGYYSGYPPSQMTPEPPSPAGPGGTGAYDVASFLQQQAALAQQSGIASNPFGANIHYGVPQPPLSPSSSGRTMGVIPPASPLFPRAASNAAGLPSSALDQQHDSALPRMGAPPSPSVYMSPPLGGSNYNAMYGYGVGGGYGNANETGGNPNDSPEETTATWAERAQQNNVQASPQVQQQGVPVQYSRGNRAYSFDEMLPPSVLDHQEQQSPLTYSPYGATQTTSSNTLFTHQPWGYSPTSEVYAVPGSPLQPRPNPNAHLGGPYGGHAGMRPVFPGQQPNMPPSYFPASSPGPPIQTTASNKGPDGANLFIFHIPNHFTNLDMYHLFCQYGNLLSVRIMVEKDTGRSRGFGFVSYDSPESAAMAIKELNGFAIGNKRLKVQHKQARAQDRQPDHAAPLDALPPSRDALPPSNRWYDAQRPAAQSAPQDPLEHPADDSGGQVLGSPDKDPTQTSGVPGADDPANAGVDVAHAPGSGGVDLNLAAAGSSTLSPLGNLEQMRSALPDVSE